MKNNLVVSNLLIQNCSPLGLQIRASGDVDVVFFVVWAMILSVSFEGLY